MARHIFMRIYIRCTRTNVSSLSNESSSYTKLDAFTYTRDSRRDATCLIICILRIRAALHRLMPVYSPMLRVYAAKGRIVTVPHSPFHLLNRGRGRANKGALMKPRSFVRYHRIPLLFRDPIDSRVDTLTPPLPSPSLLFSFLMVITSDQTDGSFDHFIFSTGKRGYRFRSRGGRGAKETSQPRGEVSQTHIYISVDGVVSWLMSRARTELHAIHHHPYRNSNESKRMYILRNPSSKRKRSIANRM